MAYKNNIRKTKSYGFWYDTCKQLKNLGLDTKNIRLTMFTLWGRMRSYNYFTAEECARSAKSMGLVLDELSRRSLK